MGHSSGHEDPYAGAGQHPAELCSCMVCLHAGNSSLNSESKPDPSYHPGSKLKLPSIHPRILKAQERIPNFCKPKYHAEPGSPQPLWRACHRGSRTCQGRPWHALQQLLYWAAFKMSRPPSRFYLCSLSRNFGNQLNSALLK